MSILNLSGGGGADFLALRADRKGWLVAMPFELFVKLVKGER